MIVVTLKHPEDFRSLMNNWNYRILDYSDDLRKVQIIPLYSYSLEDVAKDLRLYGTVERIVTPMYVSSYSYHKH